MTLIWTGDPPSVRIPRTHIEEMSAMRTIRVRLAALTAAVVTSTALALSPAAAATLTATERAALQELARDEKLAHDVYSVLYDTTGLRVYGNIAAAELTHLEAVRALMAAYDVKDPTAGKAVGWYNSATFRQYYLDFVEMGSDATPKDAGVAIEEFDIEHLKGMLEQEWPADMQLVIENLLAGSERHLAAFSR